MVSDPDNPLVLSLLRASSTAYSYNPLEKIDEVSNIFPFCRLVIQKAISIMVLVSCSVLVI